MKRPAAGPAAPISSQVRRLSGGSGSRSSVSVSLPDGPASLDEVIGVPIANVSACWRTQVGMARLGSLSDGGSSRSPSGVLC